MSAALIGGMVAGQMASQYMGQQGAEKASDKASAEAAAMRQQALAQLSGMDPIQLSELGFDPTAIEYIKGPEAIAYAAPEEVQAQTVETDPLMREAQVGALSDLSQRAEEGMSAQDKYNFMKNRRQVETQARGQEQAIMENMKQRGMGGSGIEAAMRMMSQQGGTGRLAESEALQAAENAKMRMAATQAQGQMAGGIRQQDIGQGTTNANILNQLAWNNSERNRKIANMNIDMKNQYAQKAINEQRRVQDVNVDMSNQAQLMNKQQQIANEKIKQESERQKQMASAGALSGGIPDIYAGGAADAAGQRQQWNTIGAGINTAGQMYMSQQQADQASADRDKDREALTSMYQNVNANTNTKA